MIFLEVVEGVGDSSRYALSVWRLEAEDDEYWWTKKCDIVLKTATSSSSALLWGKYELDKCSVLCLHPEKPEIVFFRYMEDCVFSFDSSMGTAVEPELLSAVKLKSYEDSWRVFQPRVSGWPTPIPRYDKFRGIYDGRFDCWVQTRVRNPKPWINKVVIELRSEEAEMQ